MNSIQSTSVTACSASTNSNSPQSNQVNPLEKERRSVKEIVDFLSHEFFNNHNEAPISTTINKLRQTYPDLNQRGDFFWRLLQEVKKQRKEDPKRKGLPVLEGDLSWKISELFTQEEQAKTLPAEHPPIRKYEWKAMTTSSHSTEPDLKIDFENIFSEGLSFSFDGSSFFYVVKNAKSSTSPQIIIG